MARPGKSLPEAAALRGRMDEKGMLAVRVVPNAAADRILLVEDDNATVTVRTTATPEGGKANEAVVRLLAKALDVPASSVQIVRGATSRTKLIRVAV